MGHVVIQTKEYHKTNQAMEKPNRLQGLIVGFMTLLLFLPGNASAQYFGRNKPGYKKFDYKVYQTPNFEIYHYFKNDSVIKYWATETEKWYTLHSQLFRDTFEKKNPLILYANPADFQQTTAISGDIGIGTGGVTEALKNRVVLPLAATTAQTDHVLGHELVHAFQYHLLTSGDSTSLASVRNLPLWMVEGMAEYFSIGSVDDQTAMWMRDALLQKDFPSLKDLTNNSSKYFPYRYGQAFWAMVGKIWGDNKIVPLFLETAKYGYEQAIDSLLGVSAETFSSMWKSSYLVHYAKYLKDSVDQMNGKKLFDEKNAGRLNISPSISPNGKYVAFFSEREVVSIDLFLADVESGKILKKLSSRVSTSEIDDFNFIESAGTWSPDGKKFAFVVFSKGVNKLVILDVEKSKVLEETELAGVPAINNPSWSPDGKQIVVAGMADGIPDLYAYNVFTGETNRLTHDNFSEAEPSWSADGKTIVFSTDRTVEGTPGKLQKPGYNLALLDVKSGEIRVLPVFIGAENLNPLFSPEGDALYFLSNSDGFRNLYKYELATDKLMRMTDYMTGISGITPMSPAVSMARDMDRFTYSYYWKNGYQIYAASSDDFHPVEVKADSLNFEAATLPPWNRVGANLVDARFDETTHLPEKITDSFTQVPFRAKFKLDYISNVNAGVSTTSRYGTGMAGSVLMQFSDMVGNNQLFAQVALNGEIYDFGAEVAYINQKRKINWGSTLSHIPYLSAYYDVVNDTLSTSDGDLPVTNFRFFYYRMFEDQASMFSYFPLSQTRRFEAGASLSRYYYRIDQFNNYYDPSGIYYYGASREKVDAPSGFTIFQVDGAYVEDNSTFGIASPVKGHRGRIAFEKYNGTINMYTALIDYRKYFYLRPFTFAFRAYHYGRYGQDAENSLMYPLYLGYPWLIRGYSINSFNNQQFMGSEGVSINQLAGSRIAVSNVEIRFPFTGPERYGLIKFKYLPSEFTLFADGGVAWDSQNKPHFKWLPDTPDERVPILSIGVSLRVNVLGYIILEPYYAMPVQREIQKGVFGVNFVPGW
jgi:Tol biopolymer transport system component